VDYPLCKSLGLEVFDKFHSAGTSYYVRASDVERLLSKGVRVFAYKQNPWDEPFAKKEQRIWAARQDSYPNSEALDPSTALLIDIKPIVRERRRELSEAELRKTINSVLLDGVLMRVECEDEIIKRLFGEG